ncbi:MAG: hypothetical protein ABL925_09740 [Methylococcales bacterium]
MHYLIRSDSPPNTNLVSLSCRVKGGNMLKKFNAHLKSQLTNSLDLRQRIRDQKVIYSVIFGMLIVFGDTLIPAIAHVLYVALEIVNYIIEHFLERTFHMSPRQSEMTVFWGGMTINFVVLFYVLRKAYLKTILLYEAAQNKWRAMQEDPKTALYIRAAAILSTLCLTFFLLS